MIRRAFYNEVDGFCCDWISNLMDAGLITPGKIDDRSIHDVRPEDFAGYTRQHFFAGIAGWDLALNLAKWGDRPAMSGSPPCQPFSVAGKGEGFKDERHLWPTWFSLVKESKPPVIFGEEVANVVRHGWLDLVLGDLEKMSYACASLVFKASDFVGAPHQRERLYWVADAGVLGDTDDGGQSPDRGGASADAERKAAPEDGEPRLSAFWSDAQWIECRDSKLRPVESVAEQMVDGFPDGMGLVRDGSRAYISPLIRETKNRAQRLRGYGNAVVPQAAAAFVRAFMGTTRTKSLNAR
jgi:DNA (cytosine-5)-methyltransferase 1